MSHSTSFVLLLSLLAACSTPATAGSRAAAAKASAGPAPRPHVVFILADDLGWADVGFRGSDIHTPNIDALASGGVRFDQLYTQPFCTQTRAALMTGRYPLRYGLQTIVIPSASRYTLATDEFLLPQALKDAGYATSMVGKWHLGHSDQAYWPEQRGFDYHYGMNIGEIDYFTHEAHGVVDWYRNNQPVVEEGYSTRLLGADAVRQIERHDAARPLFLYLAFNAPHSPYQAPEDALARYGHIEDPTRRAYAAMVSEMDEQVGRVVAALRAKGMLENTLIVFQSDNGAAASAQFAGEIDVSKLKLPCSNGPYREGKGTNYEGGTRVIACASWPGHIPAGTVVDEPIHMVDWYPTLVGLAGGSLAKTKPLDGVDQWPTIAAGAPSARDEIVYNVETFGGALREGDWKLVWKATLPARVELFDLARDPYEKVDVSAQHPKVVARLQQRIQALALESQPALLLEDVMNAAKSSLFGTPAFPDQDPH